ncbi:hypothetical protein PGT21_019408 [Puccinia graminis f. sp. tritici]|uniref:Uncharacterized protein n=1 Tax=Puccinia graminis f. sp. tritici TaxID=56615 RepID=A0A5B0MRR1_PUCGR|nr:hypothetical protein PGT21_019408 [Puccinia graminis f. sp. tritici]
MPTTSQLAGPQGRSPHNQSLNYAQFILSTTFKNNWWRVSSAGVQDWVTPPVKCETVWKVNLTYYSWAKCQQEIIRLRAPTRKHINKHLHRLQAEGFLKGNCILHQDGTFGQNKNYYVMNNNEFALFVEAVEPDWSTKGSNKAKKVDDSLALNYVDKDTCLALQQVHAQLAVNPKANTSGQDCGRIVADITRHIKAKYGCDTKSMRIRDPEDLNRSICVTMEALCPWSQAMLHGAKRAGCLTLATQELLAFKALEIARGRNTQPNQEIHWACVDSDPPVGVGAHSTTAM